MGRRTYIFYTFYRGSLVQQDFIVLVSFRFSSRKTDVAPTTAAIKDTTTKNPHIRCFPFLSTPKQRLIALCFTHTHEPRSKRQQSVKPSAAGLCLTMIDQLYSPVTTAVELRSPVIADKLNKVQNDFLNYVEAQDSISQLSLSVNDSAGGSTYAECYDQQQVLGEGGFAKVYRCMHKVRGKSYAVKEIFNNEYQNSGENIREEIDAMKRLRDVSYIVKLLDVFNEPGRTYMIMEEMEGGDLLARLDEQEVFSERESRQMSRKLLEALYFCHKKNIVHRDIKPENILLSSRESNTNIKLADFGCAKLLTGGKCLKTLCGSPQYVAPELYLHQDGYDERCDLWSAGIVIFILLSGYAPFEADLTELPDLICEGWYTFHSKYWGHISEPPKDLIRSLLLVDPDERATLTEALDSTWLRRRDRESITAYSLRGSLSSFDAWVKGQNDSSSTSLLGDLYGDNHSTKNFLDDTDDEYDEDQSDDRYEDSDEEYADEDEDYDGSSGGTECSLSFSDL